MQAAGAGNLRPLNETLFRQLQRRFDYEAIRYCYDNDNRSRALFHTLKVLNAHPEDAWLHTMVARCLNDFWELQKQHELGKYVDLPRNGRKDEYNQLLQMIQNLRLTEIAALAYHYTRQQERFAADAEFAKETGRSRSHYQN